MYTRILIFVETAPMSSAAVAEGLAIARDHRAQVVFYAALPDFALPVVDYPARGMTSSELFEEELARSAEVHLAGAVALAERIGVRSRTVRGAGSDHASRAVNIAADLACDLVVVESTGQNAVMRLLTGSVIPGLITLSRVPVLVVRHAGTADPPGRRLEEPARAMPTRGHAHRTPGRAKTSEAL